MGVREVQCVRGGVRGGEKTQQVNCQDSQTTAAAWSEKGFQTSIFIKKNSEHSFFEGYLCGLPFL